MPVSFFRNVCVAVIVSNAAASAGFLAFGRTASALGVWVGAAWIFLNTFFLFRLLSLGFETPSAKKKERVLVLSVLKFPVLYVAGYFVLVSRVFPMDGILTGLSLYMAAFTLFWMKANALAARPERA